MGRVSWAGAGVAMASAATHTSNVSSKCGRTWQRIWIVSYVKE